MTNIQRSARAGAALLGAAGLLGVGMATAATAASAAPYALCQMQVGTLTGPKQFAVSLRISNCAKPDDLFAVDMIKSQTSGLITASQTRRVGTLRADAQGVAAGVVQVPAEMKCEVRITATNLATGRVASARVFLEPCDTGVVASSSGAQVERDGGSYTVDSDDLLIGARPALLAPEAPPAIESEQADIELLAAAATTPDTGGINGATAAGLGVVVIAVAAGAVVSRRRIGRH